MLDLCDLEDAYRSDMSIIALNPDGGHAAVTSMPGKTYIYQSAEMECYREVERELLPIPGLEPRRPAGARTSGMDR